MRAILFATLVAIAPGFAPAATLQYRTYVAPQKGETLQGRCIYQMTLPHAERPVRGVLVIFDRGWQVGNLYFDSAVLNFATRSQLALLLAQHCPATGNEDIDVVPEHGIGRALLKALDQLGLDSRHTELSNCPLIYFGFSGAGSLAARMVNYAADRTLAAVEYAPGQGDPVGMDTVILTREALVVPQLIITNGADDHVGTARPYAYFAHYRELGAPLTFLIQNQTPHCCVMNVVPLMLEWLAEIIRQRNPRPGGSPLRLVDPRLAWIGTLDVQDSGIKEALWHAKVWNAVAAEIEPEPRQPNVGSSGIEIPRAPADAQVPGSGTLVPVWLPARGVAQMWLAFARQKTHAITLLE